MKYNYGKYTYEEVIKNLNKAIKNFEAKN